MWTRVLYIPNFVTDWPFPEYMILHITMCWPYTQLRSHRKDVKLLKRCQMSKNQTPRLWGSFTKKIETRFTHIDINFDVIYMMVNKNPQNVCRKYIWPILMTFMCDVKIDINMCEPHYVNLFLWTSLIVQVFNFLTFDIFLVFLKSLTSFWQLDIFLTFLHWLKLKPPQPVIGLFLWCLVVSCYFFFFCGVLCFFVFSLWCLVVSCGVLLFLLCGVLWYLVFCLYY